MQIVRLSEQLELSKEVNFTRENRRNIVSCNERRGVLNKVNLFNDNPITRNNDNHVYSNENHKSKGDVNNPKPKREEFNRRRKRVRIKIKNQGSLLFISSLTKRYSLEL